MMRTIAALRKNNEGATAIEFAMVAPVLFLLIFGIIEFGLIFATQSALEGATSSAARTYKALARRNGNGASANQIETLVTRYGGGLVKAGPLRVTARRLPGGWGTSSMPDGNSVNNNSGRTGRTGQVIQYRVYYDYSVKTPMLGRLLGGRRNVVSMQASTVVQNEPSIGGANGA